MIYTWQKQKAMSDKYAYFFLDFYQRMLGEGCWQAVTLDEDKQGIDRWLWINGSRVSVQEKMDKYTYTGNVFLEAYNNFYTKDKGCIHHCAADIVIYGFTDGRLYPVRTEDIKDLLLDCILRGDRLITVSNLNKCSAGYIVPVGDLPVIDLRQYHKIQLVE